MEAFAILLLLVSLFYVSEISYSVDTIDATGFLADGQTLVSSQGSYELGFFSPDNSSGNRYLGIWLRRIANGTVVWVANRDTPLTNSSGVLRISQQGNLTLLSASSNGTVVWSVGPSRPSQNPVAQLLDSGNLVVRDAVNGDGDPNNFLWQSFDVPTDTLLPGMKLGKSFHTGIDRVLWNWRANNDPARGDFSFRFDTNGYPQEFLRRGSVDTFRSGPWNGLRFSGSPGLRPNNIYTFKFVFNEEEVYYGFDLVNADVFSRLVLNQNGILQRQTWNNRTGDWTGIINAPADNCDAYGLCQAYGTCNIANSPVCGCLDRFVPKYPRDWAATDWSNGCVRRTPLNCSQGAGFLRYSSIKLPDTRNSWYNTTMNLEECERVCLRNCSCMAYANLDIRNGGSGCLLWFDDLIDIRELPESGQDIYIRMASSELGGSYWTKGRKIALGLAIPLGLLLIGLIVIFCLWNKNKKRQQQLLMLEMEGGIGHSSEHGSTTENQKEDLELPLLDLAIIVEATNDFSVKNKLGQGGFGAVYKGMLKEGQEIAVKRLSRYSAQGLDEFKNEVICIAKLQHRNLVKLLGCCIEGEEKMLIYEYMPNRSLDLFIFDETRCRLLDWPKRFNIIKGIARGLLYLHQDSRLRIIHRDLKASNILLDLDMNPKISDFGMARSFGGNETEGNTRRVVGTYGYMSPEYAVDGIFSVKSDVFSFGVLILEIVSGKKNRGFFHPDHHHNLLGHAWLLFKEGRSLELIDDSVVDSADLSEVLRSIHVSLLCVQQSPEDRPNMSYVVLMLGSEGTLPQPKEPGFFTERNLFFDPDSSSGKNAVSSGNELSITLLDAR